MKKMRMKLEMKMSERVVILDEPRLQFWGGHYAIDPHDGLALFGPYESITSPHSPQATHIVIGTQEGLSGWSSWSMAFNRPAVVIGRDTRLWPPFPGYDVAFGAPWPEHPIRLFSLERDKLLSSSRKKDRHERCYAVVGQIMNVFEVARKLDIRPSVAVCVIPDEIWHNCRPESVVANPSDEGISRKRKRDRTKGQMELFTSFNIEQYRLAPDFRRQLKARSMKFDIPIQIILESTLRLADEQVFGQRGMTPVSDRMWNIGTALYYKSGGRPWKLADAREGVCYVGLAFRRASEGDRTACCAAQMFLDSGDGIVFLGEYGPWYSQRTKEFQLSCDAARNLLSGVLRTYNEIKTSGDPPLREIFLHSRSSISEEEFSGYQEACPSECRLVCIRVRKDRVGFRLFRDGHMPVMRGTFCVLDEKSGYLYASGFKPRIASYDGWETPAPLRIDVQYGIADIEVVAKDILALTKLNYNACRLGEGQPVTVGFSDAVGEILVSNPTVTDRRPNFKYYI